jgi:hypothetical protein
MPYIHRLTSFRFRLSSGQAANVVTRFAASTIEVSPQSLPIINAQETALPLELLPGLLTARHCGGILRALCHDQTVDVYWADEHMLE